MQIVIIMICKMQRICMHTTLSHEYLGEIMGIVRSGRFTANPLQSVDSYITFYCTKLVHIITQLSMRFYHLLQTVNL